MRTRALALVLLVLGATAGCFGNDDEPGTTTTPPTNETTTPTPGEGTNTSTPPTATTPSDTPPAVTTPENAPAPQPPKIVYERTFDFTQGDATGQSPKVETSQAVTEGYANVTVNLTITRASNAPTPLPVSGTVNSPMVRVLDPTGQELVAAGDEGTAINATYPSAPGAWTIRFEGAGTLQARIVLTATP